MLKNQRKDTYNTNCVAKVCECAGLESPLTPTLSPLDKGGEGREWGILHAQEFMNSGSAIGIIPTALPKFVNAQDSNPPSPRPSPP
jgi:hypothetical protein